MTEGSGDGADDLEPLIAAIADLSKLNDMRRRIQAITWIIPY